MVLKQHVCYTKDMVEFYSSVILNGTETQTSLPPTPSTNYVQYLMLYYKTHLFRKRSEQTFTTNEIGGKYNWLKRGRY